MLSQTDDGRTPTWRISDLAATSLQHRPTHQTQQNHTNTQRCTLLYQTSTVLRSLHVFTQLHTGTNIFVHINTTLMLQYFPFDSEPFDFQVTTLGKLFTHIFACVTKQYDLAPVNGPCGWEGNRRSGVALAMRHRLQWFIQLQAHSPDREMSTRPMLSCGVRPIYLPVTASNRAGAK